MYDKKLKLIIAGGRDFSDWEQFYRELNAWFAKYDPTMTNTVIIVGMADGADTMGWLVADERGIPWIGFEAEWDKYGPYQSGFIRNQIMADEGTHLLAFWNGISGGTGDMINRATTGGLVVDISRYKSKVKRTRIKTLW